LQVKWGGLCLWLTKAKKNISQFERSKEILSSCYWKCNKRVSSLWFYLFLSNPYLYIKSLHNILCNDYPWNTMVTKLTIYVMVWWWLWCIEVIFAILSRKVIKKRHLKYVNTKGQNIFLIKTWHGYGQRNEENCSIWDRTTHLWSSIHHMKTGNKWLKGVTWLD